MNYPILFYTSGTPHRTGQLRCAMERWLGNHAGVHGTGWSRVKRSIPLATGSAVHKGVELLLTWIAEWQKKYGQRLYVVPPEVVAWAATEAARRYRATAEKRGLQVAQLDPDSGVVQAQLVNEQAALVEALVFIYAWGRLPMILTSARLIANELECPPVLDCTCGLGDWVGDDVVHATRGCTGIVAQARGDSLWQADATGSIIYEEVKTKAQEHAGWKTAWEHSQQIWINASAVGAKLGVQVEETHVVVLYKGRFSRPYKAPMTVPKSQQSKLIYGYVDQTRQDGLPRWAWSYDYLGDDGKWHKLGKAYQKVLVTDESIPLQAPERGEYQPARDGASRVERWLTWHMPKMELGEFYEQLPALPRNAVRQDVATRGFLVEEREWKAKVEYLRQQQAFTPDHPLVEQVITRSWNCTNYDNTPCQFRFVCEREPGWENPGTSGRYEIRRPHHSPERIAFEQAGVVFPASDEGDEDDESRED